MKSSLTHDVQGFAAGGENFQIRRSVKRIMAQLRARLNQVFAIVEDKQEIFRAEVILQNVCDEGVAAFMQIENRREGLGYQRRVRERSKINQPYAVGERAVAQISGRFEREPRFAATARTREHQQASCTEQSFHIGDLAFATDERSQLKRKVRGNCGRHSKPSLAKP